MYLFGSSAAAGKSYLHPLQYTFAKFGQARIADCGRIWKLVRYFIRDYTSIHVPIRIRSAGFGGVRLYGLADILQRCIGLQRVEEDSLFAQLPENLSTVDLGTLSEH